MAINASTLSELRTALKASTIVTRDDENYAASLHRWAESAEKPAVSFSLSRNSDAKFVFHFE